MGVYIDKEILSFYIDCGIISLGDVMSNTEVSLMNKILKQVHPYKIYFSESDKRWHTQVTDVTQPRGYRQIVRKKECDLQKYLLQFYNIKNTTVYTFESLYNEFMEYKKATQKKGTINMYIKAYNKFYEGDDIATQDLSTLDTTSLKVWLCNNINKYKMNYKAYNQMSVVLNQMYKYAIEKGYLEKNPFNAINARSLGLYNTKKKKSSQKAYTKTEAKSITQIAFEDFSNNPHSTALAILLAFQTGMRVGEIVVLKWSDIDYEDNTITVQRMENHYQESSEDNKSLGKCRYEIIEGNTKGIFGERIVD
jgi:integrase